MKNKASELIIAIIFLIIGVALCIPVMIKQEKAAKIEKLKRDKIEELLMDSLLWKTQRMRVYVDELFRREQ